RLCLTVANHLDAIIGYRTPRGTWRNVPDNEIEGSPYGRYAGFLPLLRNFLSVLKPIAPHEGTILVLDNLDSFRNRGGICRIPRLLNPLNVLVDYNLGNVGPC